MKLSIATHQSRQDIARCIKRQKQCFDWFHKYTFLLNKNSTSNADQPAARWHGGRQKMDLQQLLSLWELLAGVAVGLACQRMTPEERNTILEYHEQSRAVADADDFSGWQEINLRFHELIYKATRNPYLRQEVLRMRARTGYYRKHAFGAPGQIRTSFEQHQHIVEAFMASDGDAASTAMLTHMRPASDAKGLTDFIVNIPKEVLAR